MKFSKAMHLKRYCDSSLGSLGSIYIWNLVEKRIGKWSEMSVLIIRLKFGVYRSICKNMINCCCGFMVTNVALLIVRIILQSNIKLAKLWTSFLRLKLTKLMLKSSVNTTVYFLYHFLRRHTWHVFQIKYYHPLVACSLKSKYFSKFHCRF